mgnify:CR=1 FL=1
MNHSELILKYFESNVGMASGAMIECEAFKTVIRGKTLGIRRELEQGLNRTENQMRTLEKEEIQDRSRRDSLEECCKTYSTLVERLCCHNYQNYLARAHSEEVQAGKIGLFGNQGLPYHTNPTT